ncbi:hypothetical protein B0H14DRAFT_2584886 [Mycena olivaceomarginata]|nr:hypothetical protein B0H14DRAFT_2584886 [Mycena olivaceomarginata]
MLESGRVEAGEDHWKRRSETEKEAKIKAYKSGTEASVLQGWGRARGRAGAGRHGPSPSPDNHTRPYRSAELEVPARQTLHAIGHRWRCAFGSTDANRSVYICVRRNVLSILLGSCEPRTSWVPRRTLRVESLERYNPTITPVQGRKRRRTQAKRSERAKIYRLDPADQICALLAIEEDHVRYFREARRRGQLIVKWGESACLARRQLEYDECGVVGKQQMWFWGVRERVIRLALIGEGYTRFRFEEPCSCGHCHREYHWMRPGGSLEEIEIIARECLAIIEEPTLYGKPFVLGGVVRGTRKICSGSDGAEDLAMCSVSWSTTGFKSDTVLYFLGPRPGFKSDVTYCEALALRLIITIAYSAVLNGIGPTPENRSPPEANICARRGRGGRASRDVEEWWPAGGVDTSGSGCEHLRASGRRGRAGGDVEEWRPGSRNSLSLKVAWSRSVEMSVADKGQDSGGEPAVHAFRDGRRDDREQKDLVCTTETSAQTERSTGKGSDYRTKVFCSRWIEWRNWSIEQKLAVDLIDAVSLDLDILLPPHPKLASSLKKVITTLEEQWNKHFEDNSRWRPSNTPGLESVTERATNILFEAVADAWSHIQATQPTEPQQIEIGCKQAPSFLPGSGFVDKKNIDRGKAAISRCGRTSGPVALPPLSRTCLSVLAMVLSTPTSAQRYLRISYSAQWWILANKHMFWSGPVYNRRDKGQELVDETPDGIYTFFGDAPHPNKRQIDVFLLFLAVVLRGAYEQGKLSLGQDACLRSSAPLASLPQALKSTPSPSPFTPTGEDVNVAAEPDDDNCLQRQLR